MLNIFQMQLTMILHSLNMRYLKILLWESMEFGLHIILR